MTGLLAASASVIAWWLALVGAAAVARVAAGDRWPAGDALVHALGRWMFVVAVGLVAWLAAHVVAIPLSTLVRSAAAIVAATLLWRAAKRWQDRRPDVAAVDAAIGRFLRREGLFAGAFVAYLVMRGYNHDIYGLEKYMDFAFVNATRLAGTMPPPDPWLAGHTINYYYFGHALAAMLIEFTGAPAAIGYNLMLATLFAATFELAAALAGDVAAAFVPRLAPLAAGIAGLWITVGGNLHGYLYGAIRPAAARAGWIDPPAKPYWLSDSTRFVGHDPPTGDKLIHEFPAYAFYVGDLHAHLIDLPTVLALLALVLLWLRIAARGDTRGAGLVGAALGAAVGMMAMTNAWDAAIYGPLAATAVLVAGRHPPGGTGGRTLAATIAAGVVALVVVLAPFAFHFTPFAAGWDWVRSRTPAWQWLVLYGAQGALALAAVGLLRRDAADDARPAWRWLATIAAFGFLCALVPELLYVRDIYTAEHYRSNTAFKFGFQAFVLLVLAASVGVVAVIERAAVDGRPWRAVAVMQLAIVPCLYYAWFVASGSLGVAALRSWTLDGRAYLARGTPEDHAAIRWLEKHARPGETLVEAVGDSYSYAARISTNTGVPALLGWPMHQWLWRGVDKKRDLLAHEIAALYRDPGGATARALVARARPTYVVLGRLERQRHGPVDVAGVEALGEVVFRAGATSIVRLPPTP